MEEMKYTKEQLLASERFRARRDALAVCLDKREYTLAEAEETLTKFLERSV